MLFMENDGKILSHNAQINTAFFFPSVSSQPEGCKDRVGRGAGALRIRGSHFGLQGSISRGRRMTSRATNVAPNEPAVNRDIRPRCLILAAPLGRPQPPSGAGKPQESLEAPHLGASSLQRGHGRTPSLGIWGGEPQKRTR